MRRFSTFSLISRKGQRKYLNEVERQRFFEATQSLPLDKQMFCQMLYYTGARFSEVLELRVPQIDFVDKTVIFRTLKQRRLDVYRQIPLPDKYMGSLMAYIDVTYRKESQEYNIGNQKVWPFASRTASRLVKTVMNEAEIHGVQASAKGLRHGFAVYGVTKVPLSLVQKWMGHSSLETTAIYLQVSGMEERSWAEKMWVDMA